MNAPGSSALQKMRTARGGGVSPNPQPTLALLWPLAQLLRPSCGPSPNSCPASALLWPSCPKPCPASALPRPSCGPSPNPCTASALLWPLASLFASPKPLTTCTEGWQGGKQGGAVTTERDGSARDASVDEGDSVPTPCMRPSRVAGFGTVGRGQSEEGGLLGCNKVRRGQEVHFLVCLRV
jgi:hypothetical protein